MLIVRRCKMSENRVCPLSENEIPEEARFICRHCNFELKWLDDEAEIGRTKKLPLVAYQKLMSTLK